MLFLFLIALQSAFALCTPGYTVACNNGSDACTYSGSSDDVSCYQFGDGDVTIQMEWAGGGTDLFAIDVTSPRGNFCCLSSTLGAGANDGVSCFDVSSGYAGHLTVNMQGAQGTGCTPHSFVTYITTGLGDSDITGSDYTDIIGGGYYDDDLYGMGGEDYISGGTGDDYIEGNAGPDHLLGQGGSDYIDGGPQDDTIDVGTGCNNIALGGNGSDDITGSNDVGCTGDYIDGGGDADTKLDGQAGPDTICGGSGDDSLQGGTGDDYLYGGAGNDAQDCGSGIDRNENDSTGLNACESTGGAGHLYTTSCPAVPAWP